MQEISSINDITNRKIGEIKKHIEKLIGMYNIAIQIIEGIHRAIVNEYKLERNNDNNILYNKNKYKIISSSLIDILTLKKEFWI